MQPHGELGAGMWKEGQCWPHMGFPGLASHMASPRLHVILQLFGSHRAGLHGFTNALLHIPSTQSWWGYTNTWQSSFVEGFPELWPKAAAPGPSEVTISLTKWPLWSNSCSLHFFREHTRHQSLGIWDFFLLTNGFVLAWLVVPFSSLWFHLEA